jgi:hypothetical protein
MADGRLQERSAGRPCANCSRTITRGLICEKGRGCRKAARPARPTLAERFWPKVSIGPGCWEWTGALGGHGYGQFHIGDGRKIRYAHRVAYELTIGRIPPGLSLDHLCRNPPCVNPAHLEPVTHKVNIVRGDSPLARNSRKTHCRRGHELSGANLEVASRKAGHRRCRICRNASWLRRKWAARAAALSAYSALEEKR